MLSPEEIIEKLKKIIIVKDTLIATHRILIATQDAKITDLEDQIAAANTVIAECKQFIDTLATKEEKLNNDIANLAMLTS